MATRTREGVTGKEKRGTSPSNAAVAVSQRMRSSNPSKTTSPVRSPDSASAEKHVPNYLKPTVSSGLDASKQLGKKPVLSGPEKHVLGRRRSFDKPPSASATKISQNPIRTSSFSGKMNVSHKAGASDKSSRGSKDATAAGKQQQHGLYARPAVAVKKSNVKKREPVSGSGKTPTKEQVSNPTEKVDVSSVTDVSETETLSENQDSPVADCEQHGVVHIGEHIEEDAGKDDFEVEVHENGDKDSVMGDEEKGVKELKAGNNLEEEEESLKFEQQSEAEVENPINLDDDANTRVTTESCLEIQEAKIVSIDTWSTTEDPQEQEGHATVIVKTQEQEDNMTQVEELKEPTAVKTEESNPCIQNEEMTQREDVTDINEAGNSKEMEVQKEVVEDNLPEAAEPVASSKTEIVQGKKDAATVSNDVIEETAKQLREQRKNKVKALAGAFETVISLQEHK